MAKFGKELAVRTLTGIVLVLSVTVLVLVSRYGFLLLMAVVATGNMLEFFRMARHKGCPIAVHLPIFVGLVAIVLSFFVAARYVSSEWLFLLFPLVSCIFAKELFAQQPQPFSRIGISIVGLFYAALPLALFNFVAFFNGFYDPKTILAYIFIVWINDVFAYLTGSSFGIHHMAPNISPNKSWEGFFGGLFAALLFGAGVALLFGQSVVWWCGLAFVVVISAAIGDLVESMFKRSVGLKDSGAFLPGHGGFLDRFDALIFSVPFVLAYFTIFVK